MNAAGVLESTDTSSSPFVLVDWAQATTAVPEPLSVAIISLDLAGVASHVGEVQRHAAPTPRPETRARRGRHHRRRARADASTVVRVRGR